jgi:HK97 family phage major capsid protein
MNTNNNPRELRDRRAAVLQQASDLVRSAEDADRDLNTDEQTRYDDLLNQAASLEVRAARLEQIPAGQTVPATRQAPAMNRIPLGDNEARAMAHYLRTGDAGGLRELRASNNTDMNVGTSADGGYTVPTGHHQGIIARRDESMLARKLGVRNIPGKGTTVNVPLDSEADGEFVSAAEANAYDRDAPALGQKAMTLVKYTKKVELSVELLEDEDSRLMDFLNDYVGRGMAKTHNSLLLTEVAANGTALKTYASATAVAVGEPEDIVYQDDLVDYLDDTMSVAWVMRGSTYGNIVSLAGNSRHYALQEAGSSTSPRALLGYPVHYSNKAAATAASAKDAYFGNWNFVGLREAPEFTVLRDPYTNAHLGQIRLLYMFRAVYGVLQAEAIGYGVHPSA